MHLGNTGRNYSVVGTTVFSVVVETEMPIEGAEAFYRHLPDAQFDEIGEEDRELYRHTASWYFRKHDKRKISKGHLDRLCRIMLKLAGTKVFSPIRYVVENVNHPELNFVLECNAPTKKHQIKFGNS